MTALRTTRSAVPRPSRLPLPACAVLALGVFGCGTPPVPQGDQNPQPVAAAPGANDPAWLTSREKLPTPPLDLLDYDPQKRTLRLYELPGRDVWMVQLPDEPRGHLAGPVCQLPEGVDLARTLVYYARPGVKVSAAVTVATINAGRRPHSSGAVAFGP